MKLLEPWLGSFQVKLVDQSQDNITLDLPHFLHIHPTFHTQWIKPYIHPTKHFPNHILPSKPDAEPNEESRKPEFEVEEIIGCKWDAQ
ncbi:hypothetical protein HK096_009595, partial [Nowakowskiella sp. JEL0078]